MSSGDRGTKGKNLQASLAHMTLVSRGLVVEQTQSEVPLILFTLFIPTSLGIALAAFLFGSSLLMPVVVLVLATIGMLASIAHLAKPFRAPYSILHWKNSWLSREILAVSAHWTFCLAWLLLAFSGQAMLSLIAHVFVALFGFVLVAIIGRAYMTHARPAWNGYENILELLSVVFGLGFAVGALLASVTEMGSSRLPFIVCACMVLLGCILFAHAHKLRIKRLSDSLEEASYKQKVDRANYPKREKLRLIASLQLLAWAISVVATVFLSFSVAAASLWLVVVLAEMIAQTKARHLFYELPVQTKHVPR